jgi:DNA polymerase beta
MDYRDLIHFNLSCLIKKYNKNNTFKVRAYKKALSELPETPIYSMDDVMNVGGDKTKEKLKCIFETKKNLEEVDEFLNNSNYEILDTLQKVHGIGPAKAKDLFENKKIKSIEDLKNNIELLNNVQKMGLKYYDDIEKKIPITEMNKHDAFLKLHIQDIEFVIAGSYRRKSKTSGDIDILLTGDANNLNKVVTQLQDVGYLNKEAVLAHGGVKYMGLCKLPKHKTFRRVDILFTEKHEYPFALLYFTGNFKFNVDMRKHALTKGYTLNEQGLYSVDTKELVDYIFNTEEDIFTFLDYKYVKPEDRLN